MNNFLHSLVCDRVEQIQNKIIPSQKFSALKQQELKQHQKIKNLLNNKQWRLFDDYLEIISQQNDLFCEETYIQGFKDAFKLISTIVQRG